MVNFTKKKKVDNKKKECIITQKEISNVRKEWVDE